MEVFQTKIEADGTIRLSQQILEQSEFEAGQIIEIEVEKKSLRVSLSAAEQRKQAQEFVRQKIQKTNSAVEEFIEERRQEAVSD